MSKRLRKKDSPGTRPDPAAGARLCIHMPSYNAGRFLLATVRRIPFDRLAQGFSTVVLFVDNASTDDSRSEIEKARAELAAIAQAGVSLDDVTDTLLREGIASFEKSFETMTAGIKAKVAQLHSSKI